MYLYGTTLCCIPYTRRRMFIGRKRETRIYRIPVTSEKILVWISKQFPFRIIALLSCQFYKLLSCSNIAISFLKHICQSVFFNLALDIFRDDCLINHPVLSNWSFETIHSIWQRYLPKNNEGTCFDVLHLPQINTIVWTQMDWKSLLSWHKLYIMICLTVLQQNSVLSWKDFVSISHWKCAVSKWLYLVEIISH